MYRSILFFLLLFCSLKASNAQNPELVTEDSLETYFIEAKTAIYTDYTKALQLLEEIEHITQRTPSEADDAELALYLGTAHYVKGEYALSFQNYLKALEIFRNSKNFLGMAKALNGQGLIQQGIDRNAEAVSLFNQSIEAFKKADAYEESHVGYLNIAISEVEIGKFEAAKKNLQIAIDLADAAGNTNIKHLSWNKLGEIHLKEENLDKAIEFYKKVLKHEVEPNDWEKSFAHAGLAQVFLKLNKLRIAEEHALKSFNYAKSIQSLWDLERNTEILVDVYETMNETALAFDYLKLNVKYRDSLYNEMKLREINLLQLESKEAENLILKSENDLAAERLFINKVIIGSLLLMTLFLFLFVFLLKKNSRQRENFTKELEEKNKTITSQNQLISQKNEHLDSLNRSKDRLFSILSHDLKSPIGAIQQLLELIKMGQFSEEEQKQLIDEMHTQVSGTSAMLQNLLQWANTQMEGTNLKIQEVILPQQVSKTLEAHYLVAKHKNIQIQHEVPEDLSKILVDKGQVAVILQNLISNAIKYTLEGRKIEIKYLEDVSFVHLKILDGGEGIAEDKIEEIMQTDLRMPSELGTTMEVGTGIGLLLIKQFLKMNEGRLQIKSYPGRGTEFTVSFNKAEEK